MNKWCSKWFSNTTLSKSSETERWWLPTKPPEKADTLLPTLCRRKCPFIFCAKPKRTCENKSGRDHYRAAKAERGLWIPTAQRWELFPLNHTTGLLYPQKKILFLWEFLLWTEWQGDRNNSGTESVTFSISTTIYHHQIYYESIIKLTKPFLASIPQFKPCSTGLDLVGNVLDCIMAKNRKRAPFCQCEQTCNKNTFF